MSSFDHLVISSVNLIRCPKYIGTGEVKELAAFIDSWVKTPTRLHVLDFKDVSYLSPMAYSPIGVFRKRLLKTARQLVSINMSDTVGKQIVHDGMENVFQPIHNFEEALKMGGLTTAPNQKDRELSLITVKFLKPFISAVTVTFAAMVGIRTRLVSPKPVKDKNTLDIDIASIIFVSNQFIQGTLAFYFPQKVFRNLFKRTLKSDADALGLEGQDLARELLNIVFFKAKTEWNNNLGYAFQRGFPQSFVGAKLETHKLEFVPKSILLAFETSEGHFYMGILLKKKQNEQTLSYQE